jgi:hypothetical protein
LMVKRRTPHHSMPFVIHEITGKLGKSGLLQSRISQSS